MRKYDEVVPQPLKKMSRDQIFTTKFMIQF